MLNLECRFASLLLGFIAHSHYDSSITIFHSFCLLGHWQVHFLYKGTLRVLLVLLHDFPEFLCDYHFTFCDVIPPSCIQMRNIILSAFPRNMRLPDPSTPNLKVPDWLYVILVKRFIKRKIPDGNWFFFICRLIYLQKSGNPHAFSLRLMQLLK